MRRSRARGRSDAPRPNLAAAVAATGAVACALLLAVPLTTPQLPRASHPLLPNFAAAQRCTAPSAPPSLPPLVLRLLSSLQTSLSSDVSGRTRRAASGDCARLLAAAQEGQAALTKERAESGTLAPPPAEVPEAMRSDFTMQGAIPVSYFFVDDSRQGHGTHYIFPGDDIDRYVTSAQAQRRLLEETIAEEGLDAALQATSVLAYPLHRRVPRQVMDLWLSQAMHAQQAALQGSRVLVLGSSSPWVEAAALAHGAKEVVTVEYNQLTYEHPGISTVTPHALFAQTNMGTFDAAFAISSLDHDGLGRYGDPVNPFADFQAMERLACLVRDAGLLFLSVPCGPDALVWNLHRRYGRKRLPELLKGWHVQERYGWHEERLDVDADVRQSYEPVFVLTPQSSSAHSAE